MAFLLLALGGLLFSAVGVAGIRAWSWQRNLLDLPNERSSHTVPTPRGGGLAIVFVTLVGIMIYWAYDPQSLPPTALAGYVLGALLIGAVSWLDDLHSLPYSLRLAVHILGALLCIAGSGYWHTLSTPLGTFELGWAGFPITLIWLVGLTNAYNFMDGIDGMAGAQAMLAGAGWALLAWITAQPALLALALLVSASSLGFLSYNWSPASIFMGDVGSAFLGYTFATLSVLASQSHPALIVSGAALQWLFMFDTGFTLLCRWRRGENLFTAHRSHLYQRLVAAGQSHRAVASLYAICGVIGVCIALMAMQTGSLVSLSVWLIPLFCLALWLWVNSREHFYAKALYKRVPDTDRNIA